MAAVSAAACLLLVGFGYLLSQSGSSSSSYPATAAAPATASAAAGTNGHGAASSVPGSAGKAISPTSLKPAESQQIPFLVTRSDINYQQATLGAQVRGELTRRSQSSRSTGGSLPSQNLIGCVRHVTGNALPSLVEEATYEGKTAYVIAVSDHAWVVGPSCTASNPDVIASAAVPG